MEASGQIISVVHRVSKPTTSTTITTPIINIIIAIALIIIIISSMTRKVTRMKLRYIHSTTRSAATRACCC